MGTIRNRVVIVHHYRKEEIEEVRQDAVDFFQKVVLEDNEFPNTMLILKWSHL